MFRLRTGAGGFNSRVEPSRSSPDARCHPIEWEIEMCRRLCAVALAALSLRLFIAGQRLARELAPTAVNHPRLEGRAIEKNLRSQHILILSGGWAGFRSSPWRSNCANR